MSSCRIGVNPIRWPASPLSSTPLHAYNFLGVEAREQTFFCWFTDDNALSGRFFIPGIIAHPIADSTIIPITIPKMFESIALTPHEALSGIAGSISLASWIFLLVRGSNVSLSTESS